MSGVRSSARAGAAASLRAVLDGGRSIGSQVERCSGDMSGRDLRLLRELLAGAVRWLAFLDSVIARAAERSTERIDRRSLNHLRVGVYQLLFLDRVPARAAVHEAVNLAKKGSGSGAGRFVNAVLRAVARKPDLQDWHLDTGDRITDLAINTSHPELIVRSWLNQFGDAAVEHLHVNNQPKRSLGVSSSDRDGVMARLRDQGAEVERSKISPIGLCVRGAAPQVVAAAGGYIQDEASQAAALVPPPGPGERVFDAAASPGGKLLALRAVEPKSEILAADLRLDRFPRLLANLDRLSLGARVRVLVADALAPALDLAAFDRVVFDAPCTGSGTLRKNPELKWRIDDAEIDRLCRLQLAGLLALAPLVRPGGRLCYITCSMEQEENGDVVGMFLDRYPDWRLEQLSLPSILEPHLTGPGRWQIAPGGDHDGATTHVLQRVG